MEDENKKTAGAARLGRPPKAQAQPEVGIEKEDIQSSVDNSEQGETVVVNRKDLESFLARLESIEAENKKLVAVADKGRLYNEEERRAKASGTPLIHTVKLTRIGEKGEIVVAWRLIDNDSYIENGRQIERQNIEVFFRDGKSTVMRLIDFYRQQNKQTKGEVIRKSRNEQTGEVEFEVQLRDGDRLTIPQSFVN